MLPRISLILCAMRRLAVVAKWRRVRAAAGAGGVDN